MYVFSITRDMMKNNIVIGIVVTMTLGFVITGSTLTAVSAQGNMTAGGGGNMTAGGGGNMTAGGGGNMTAGGRDIAGKVKSLAVASKIIDDKKRFVVECPPDVTDPNTQCSVAKIEDYEG